MNNTLQHLKTLILDYPLVVTTMTYNTIEELADIELGKELNRRPANNLRKLKKLYDKGDNNGLVERFNSLPKSLQFSASTYSRTMGESIVDATLRGDYL